MQRPQSRTVGGPGCGSTNLNISSWIANYELDVAVEDETFARSMEQTFLEDLEHSTEIVLNARQKVLPGKNRQDVDASGRG